MHLVHGVARLRAARRHSSQVDRRVMLVSSKRAELEARRRASIKHGLDNGEPSDAGMLLEELRREFDNEETSYKSMTHAERMVLLEHESERLQEQVSRQRKKSQGVLLKSFRMQDIDGLQIDGLYYT